MGGVGDLATEFEAERDHLTAVAYRMLGSRAEAEDAVQEAWLRYAALSPAGRDEIRDLRGWLTTTTARIGLDVLRSARVRREAYPGQWLPEPLVSRLPSAAPDPAETAARSDEVGTALLYVMERLTPEQRVAFVLHDAFAVPFAEIGEILGVAEATARQYASRGRRAAADAEPPPLTDIESQRALVERLLVAIMSGDLNAVVAALHPDAELIGDANGKARTARRHIVGADKISRFIKGLADTYGVQRLALGEFVQVNGDLAMVIPDLPAEDGHKALTRRVTVFEIADGRVNRIYDMANPDKLTRLTF